MPLKYGKVMLLALAVGAFISLASPANALSVSEVRGQVLGETSYESKTIFKQSNLTLQVTPYDFDESSNTWNYSISWIRPFKRAGSIYINGNPFVNDASGKGEAYTGYRLSPSSSYSIIYYSAAYGKGVRVANRSFVTLPAEAVGLDQEDGGVATPPQPPVISARVGLLVLKPDGTVFLVGEGGLYAFPSAAVFNSWNYNFSQVLPANVAELKMIQIGIVPERQYGCGSPLDQLLGKCNGSTYIQVTTPVSGASWIVGSSQAIAWTSDSSVSYVDINIYPNVTCSDTMGGGICTASQRLATRIPNSGSFTWTVSEPTPTAWSENGFWNKAMGYKIVVVNSSIPGIIKPAIGVSGAFYISSVDPRTPTLSVSRAADSPTGKVVRGTTYVNMGKFVLQTGAYPASITAVEVDCQGCKTTGVNASEFSSFSLRLDGVQVGKSMSKIPAFPTMLFDLSGNPINLSANKSLTLSLFADIVDLGNVQPQDVTLGIKSLTINGLGVVSGLPAWANTLTLVSQSYFPSQRSLNVSVDGSSPAQGASVKAGVLSVPVLVTRLNAKGGDVKLSKFAISLPTAILSNPRVYKNGVDVTNQSTAIGVAAGTTSYWISLSPGTTVSNYGSDLFTLMADINSSAAGQYFTVSFDSIVTEASGSDIPTIIGLPFSSNSLTVVSQSTGTIRVGQLVNVNGTVYLVGDRALIGIPSLNVFNSWCFDFRDVVPANDAEKVLTQGWILESRGFNQTLPAGVSVLKIRTCPATSAVISVTSPGASVVLEGGQTYTISWSTSNADADMWVGVVEVYKDSDPSVHDDVVPRFSRNNSTGSNSWTVPARFGNGSDFHVRVMLNKGDSNYASAVSPAFSISQKSVSKPKLYVALDPATPPAAAIYPNTQNQVFTFVKFTAIGGDVALSQVSVSANTPASQTDLRNIRLLDGTNQLGSVDSLTNQNPYYTGQRWASINITNFVIPANTSKTLKIVADVMPDASGSYSLGISGMAFAGNLTADVSFSQDPFYGNVQTITSPSPWTSILSLDPATPSAQNVAPGTLNFEVFRFRLAPTQSDMNITGIAIMADSSQCKFSNVRLVDTATQLQLGNTVTAMSVSGGVCYADFGGFSSAIARNSSKSYAVKVSIPPDTQNESFSFGLASMSHSNSAYMPNFATLRGNVMTIAASATPSLTVSLDPATPVASTIQPHQSKTAALFKLVLQNDAVRVNAVTVQVDGFASVEVISIKDGSTVLATGVVSGTGQVTFSGIPITIPSNTTKVLTFDVQTSASANLGEVIRLKILNVQYIGNNTGLAYNYVGPSVSSNPLTVTAN